MIVWSMFEVKAINIAPSKFWMKKKSVIAQTISCDCLKKKLIAWNHQATDMPH